MNNRHAIIADIVLILCTIAVIIGFVSGHPLETTIIAVGLCLGIGIIAIPVFLIVGLVIRIKQLIECRNTEVTSIDVDDYDSLRDLYASDLYDENGNLK